MPDGAVYQNSLKSGQKESEKKTTAATSMHGPANELRCVILNMKLPASSTRPTPSPLPLIDMSRNVMSNVTRRATDMADAPRYKHISSKD